MEHQSPKGDCKEEHEEGSEYKHTVLTDGGCANKRASTDGSLICKGVPTDGFSQIYVGEIYIIFQNVSTSQNSIKDEMKTL